MSKIITFSGVEKCDFLYYTAKTLSQTEKTVLVVDNSYRKDMFESVDNYRGAETVERQNIIYIPNVIYSEEFFDNFDYVLIYMGMAIDKKICKKSDLNYVFCDYTPYTIRKIKEQLDEELSNCRIIMRDKATGKISEKAIAHQLEIPIHHILGFIPYDIKDYAAYTALLYNGKQKIAGLTPNFMDALEYITGEILDITAKDARKLLKKNHKKM